jgi:hypothetical protein
MKKLIMAAFLMMTLVTSANADTAYQKGWTFNSFLGGSASLPSHLTINRVDEPNINTEAHWKGRPFEDSFYYAVRFDRWKNGKARGLEWVHHKAYYHGDRPEIIDLSISDGYNLLYYNWGSVYKGFTVHKGLGLVFGNPDVTLEGRERFWNDGGFNGTFFSGVTAQYAISRNLWESKRNFVNFETKVTASFARIPISESNNEYADVPNLAFHFILGVGSKPLESHSKKDIAYWLIPPALFNTLAHI